MQTICVFQMLLFLQTQKEEVRGAGRQVTRVRVTPPTPSPPLPPRSPLTPAPPAPPVAPLIRTIHMYLYLSNYQSTVASSFYSRPFFDGTELSNSKINFQIRLR